MSWRKSWLDSRAVAMCRGVSLMTLVFICALPSAWSADTVVSNTLRFELLDNFDYVLGWQAQDADCTVERETSAGLVREGEGSMRFVFRVAREDVGKRHWIIAARRDLRFNPPRVMRVWLRASRPVPLFFSLRDEHGVEVIWRLQPEKVNSWQELTLRQSDAEFLPLLPNAPKALKKPIVRMAFFMRCEFLKKPGCYEFVIDGLRGVLAQRGSLQPRGPRLVNALDETRGLKLHGCKVSTVSAPGLFVEGKGSVKVEWRVESLERGPRWMSVAFPNLNLPPPKAISFWIRFTRRFPLKFNMDDADGTRIVWTLPSLRPGMWHFVWLDCEQAIKWLRRDRAKTPLANCIADSPIVCAQFVLDRLQIEETGEYVCYIDDLRAVYELDVFPAAAIRSPVAEVRKEEFSEGEDFWDEFSFSTPQRGRVSVSMSLMRADGAKLGEVRRWFFCAAEDTHARFFVSGSALAPGRYLVSLCARDESGRILRRVVRQLNCVGSCERLCGLEARLDALRNQLVTLDEFIRQANREGLSMPYLKTSRATLRRFIPISLGFARRGMFDRVERHVRFMERLARDEIVRARRMLTSRASSRTVPNVNLRAVRIKVGNFLTDGKPVVFIGPMGLTQKELDELPEFGFNATDWWGYWPTSMRSVLVGAGKVRLRGADELSAAWQQARSLGLLLTFCPGLKFPYWCYEKYPDTAGHGPVQAGVTKGWRHIPAPKLCGTTFWRFCMEAPNTRMLVQKYYDALLPQVAKLPPPRIYWLMNEPSYRSETSIYLKLFREHLKRKYGGVDKLNRAWGTQFTTMDDVPFPKQSDKVAWIDWLKFHQAQVTAWFKWLYERAKAADPDALITNKPTPVGLFNPRWGIDMESQARIFDIVGFDSWRGYTPQQEFALECLGLGAWRASVMVLDFFKSVAPQKPIADLEYHFAHSIGVKEYPEAYVRAAFWQSFLHGVRLCLFWVWRTEWRADSTVQYPPGARPRVAWAAGTTALDLRRLAEYVSLFPPQPAEVALFYSCTSRLWEWERYMVRMVNAYKALFFLDAPIGFVTEQMVEEGALHDSARRPKLLVVAGARYVPTHVFRAIFEYARRGGMVVVLDADAFAFDEQGHKRDTRSLFSCSGTQQLPRKWSRELSYQLDALLEKAGVTRPVRVLGRDGRNAWGVESRTAMHRGEPVTYLINLCSEGVRVQLRGFPTQQARDLISSTTFNVGRIELSPLQVLLLTPAQETEGRG